MISLKHSLAKRSTVSLSLIGFEDFCLIEIYAEENKKALCQLLGKLHLPENVDDDKIKTLKLLVYNLQSVSDGAPHS